MFSKKSSISNAGLLKDYFIKGNLNTATDSKKSSLKNYQSNSIDPNKSNKILKHNHNSTISKTPTLYSQKKDHVQD
jgi:hypothetical protein